MSAQVVTYLPNKENLDKFDPSLSLPFLEIKHITINQPSQSVANYIWQRIMAGSLTFSLQTN